MALIDSHVFSRQQFGQHVYTAHRSTLQYTSLYDRLRPLFAGLHLWKRAQHVHHQCRRTAQWQHGQARWTRQTGACAKSITQGHCSTRGSCSQHQSVSSHLWRSTGLTGKRDFFEHTATSGWQTDHFVSQSGCTCLFVCVFVCVLIADMFVLF